MVEIDRMMVEDFGISVLQMMEQAGSRLAYLSVERFLGGYADRKQVTVMAGTGGNGGGAMACARLLAGWGVKTTVVTSGPPKADSPQSVQHEIIERLGIDVMPLQGIAAVPTQDLVIDGLVGYSLSGALKGNSAAMVEWANDQPAPILSLDLPSGLEADRGRNNGVCIKAQATLTLALPKLGLFVDGSASHVGDLFLADIGIPAQLFGQLDPSPEVPPLNWQAGVIRLPVN